jgi:hypothetical protein
MAAHDDKEAGKLARKQATFERAAELRVDSAIAHLDQTREGREFLWWLLKIGRVGEQPFTANALTTAFNCGELNVGQQIQARLIAVDPAIYVRMQQEQLNDYRSAFDTPGDTSGDDDTSSAGGYDSPEHDD